MNFVDSNVDSSLSGYSACWKSLSKSGGREEGRVSGVVAAGFEENGQLRSAGRDHSHQGSSEGEGHDRGDALSLEPSPLLLPGQQRQREGQQSRSDRLYLIIMRFFHVVFLYLLDSVCM